MKFRTRDAAAALLSVILGKIAWTDSTGPESLTVSTVLSFYYEATPSVTVEHEVHPDDDAYYDEFFSPPMTRAVALILQLIRTF